MRVFFLDDAVFRLKGLFEEVLPHFSLGHAKICRSLFFGEAKTARQLHEETGVSYHKIYFMLNGLREQGIVSSVNSSPTNYLINNASKLFERLVEKKIRELQKMSQEIGEIVGGDLEAGEKEYIFRINPKNMQTRLFDNKNKALVQELQEAREIIQELTAYAKQLEPKKQYNYAVYR